MIENTSQSRVMVTCLPHKQEITGSTPVSAIKAVAASHNVGLFIGRAAFFINSPQRYDAEALKA